MTFQQELIKCLELNKKAIALEHGDRVFTYEAVHKKAIKIARFLLQADLPENSFIGIATEDRVSMICAMIGVALARHVFVPIDTKMPVSRFNNIIADNDIAYLLYTSHGGFNTSILPDSRADIEDVMVADVAEIEVLSNYDEKDSLYMYFTSGSTGKPKSIVGQNDSLLQFILWEVSEFSINKNDRFSQLISPYFDAFLRDVFVPLFAGGTVCIPESQEVFDPLNLLAWLETKQVTAIHCVPSVFRVFNSNELSEDQLGSLRYIFLSGERVIPAELKSWYEKKGESTELVNFYGATETTMIRAFYRIKSEDAGKVRIPVGKAIRGSQVLVLDETMKPCPALTPGDVYIVSEYFTKGYYKNEALNATSFITLENEEGKPLTAYKTGDRGEINADGNLDLLGRNDRQVKMRGIRIELEELENVVSASPHVKNAMAIVVKQDLPEAEIRMYVELVDFEDQENGIKELWQLLKVQLPEYMHPALLIPLKSIPLLSNGKVDIKALEKIQPQKTESATEPSNETEAKLLAIWKTVLNSDSISVTDNFLRIGGNSISLMKLIGRIYREFGVRLTLGHALKNLTVRQQAHKVQELNQDSVFVISKVESGVRFPLSKNQERMLFEAETNKDVAYNLPIAWTISEHVQIDKMVEVFNQIIERHEAFRTSFVFDDKKFWQVINAPWEIEIETIEVKGGESEILQAAKTFVRPFQLESGKLLRVGIIQSDTSRVVIADTHHIVCDGMSQINLIRDFLAFYNNQTPQPLNIQFKDYAVWENKFRESGEYAKSGLFWKQILNKKTPKLGFQPFYEAEGNGEGSHLEFFVSKDIIAQLIKAYEKNNVTAFSIIYTLYFLMLSKVTGQKDITIGINAIGRIQQEVMGIIGMFAKTLPVRFEVKGELTFPQMVLDAHNLLTEVNEKQLFDLSDITDDLIRSQILDKGQQLIETMLVFQNLDFSGLKVADNSFTPFQIDMGGAKHPLSLFVYEQPQNYLFRFEYSTSYFKAEEIQSLKALFEQMLDVLKKDTSPSLGTLLDHSSQVTKETQTLGDEITFNL
ncbi:amino acid adenylation domain-containing protein [Fulvivirga sp. 29W222]|uniref:Amino acid adenylation domain-containing protein n=1 Tax=Fulvivirga marina TaxID=2494733 RepID=A0A937G373_9BACT|nr:non-ribosomal peptide synthetase [Fulvivirga marina]MBL6449608.1 amino acid adenylation domain-containing protein [Fulvivirga marina]